MDFHMCLKVLHLNVLSPYGVFIKHFYESKSNERNHYECCKNIQGIMNSKPNFFDNFANETT
jgi:hypothetical protein